MKNRVEMEPNSRIPGVSEEVTRQIGLSTARMLADPNFEPGFVTEAKKPVSDSVRRAMGKPFERAVKKYGY